MSYLQNFLNFAWGVGIFSGEGAFRDLTIFGKVQEISGMAGEETEA